MTCETEEGYHRAVRYNEVLQEYEYRNLRTFLGHKIDVKEASEPSDILWENRMYTPFQRNCKKCIIFLIILSMLFFSFQFIFKLQKKAVSMKNRYPPHPCNDYNEQYLGRRSNWMVDAIKEY